MMKITNRAEAIKKVLELLATDRAMLYVNDSGGKDSQVMKIFLRALGIAPEHMTQTHADLGDVEWPGTKEHAQRYAIGSNGFHVVKARFKTGHEKTLLDLILKNGKMPDKGSRFCTSELKSGPITTFINGHCKETGKKIIINCIGIRADESCEREKGLDKSHYDKTGEQVVFMKDEDKSKSGREWYEWAPVFEMSTEDVYAAILKVGEELHWAYKAGMSRLSCSFCVFANKNDLTTAAKHRADLYAKYVALEKSINFTMKRKQSLEQFTGIEADPQVVAKEVAAFEARKAELKALGIERKARVKPVSA